MILVALRKEGGGLCDKKPSRRRGSRYKRTQRQSVDVFNQVELVASTWQRSSLQAEMMDSVTTEISGSNISLLEVNSIEESRGSMAYYPCA